MANRKTPSAARPGHSRLRQLVPIIESFTPTLRDLVVQQIDAMVNLVVVLERYTNRKPAVKPKAPKRSPTK